MPCHIRRFAALDDEIEPLPFPFEFVAKPLHFR